MFKIYFDCNYNVFIFDAMMITTTIRIDEDTHYTATQTQCKKLRGGFSEYVELLILDDLTKKGVKVKAKPYVKIEGK